MKNGRSNEVTDDGAVRLLLVEDDDAVLGLFSKGLQMLGFMVDEARTLHEALRNIEETRVPYDCVVADLGLPDGDGSDLILFVRRRHGESGVVVLSEARLTARRMLDLEAQALVLQKPVGIDELVEAIERRLPTRALAGAATAFAARYGLTTTEHKVLASLQDPGTRADRARRVGCRPSTYAKHLQNIFAKTNCHSTNDLRAAIASEKFGRKDSCD